VKIDLNSDMGESFGAYQMGEDEKLMSHLTSANIACGYHAGDPMVMAKTVELAKRHGVAVGAHPSYPDLLGFGRRNIETFPGEIKNYVLYQLGSLAAFTRAGGMALQHVKLHGAMYNFAAKDERAAREVIDAVKAYDPELILVALAGSLCAQMAAAAGLRVAREAFPDRAYLSNGQLAPRKMAGAVIHDPEAVKARVLKAVLTGKMMSIDEKEITLEMDTLCIHGDTPGAWRLAKIIHESLESAGVRIVSMAAA
jgi:UPF0271 protein